MEPDPQLDTTVPQTARIWNYFLGGTDNFPVDRQVGDELRRAFPQIVDNARASRAFLVRAVTYAVGEAGIRQLLDVGSGLPTADNTHEVAQRIAPEARVVYVDVDPFVIAQSRKLLTSSPEGATDYVGADAREPATVLAAAARTLDLGRPVALIMSGVLGHVPDDAQATAMIREYLDALPSGSHFIALDGSLSDEQATAERIWNENAHPPYVLRSRELFGRFFDGLDVVSPGVVRVNEWRPADGPVEHLDVVCGVGVKR